MPVIMLIVLVLATVLLLFWIPYIGIIWTHCPMPISEIVRGLIKELREAAERKFHENHHM